jgi:carbon-monoxide dehydrogenase medium subunit
MKPARFDYVRPKTLADAIVALATAQGTAVAIAGGQSLLPLLSLRMAPADILVDIGRLDELKVTDNGRDCVRIGAGFTHAAIEDGKVADPSGGLMRKVATGIAYRAVRNHGTIGGSVALADPAADWPVCLIALGAIALIKGPAGERTETVASLVRGTYSTSLQQAEIITAFDVSRFATPLPWGYAKVVRKSGAFAMAIGCVVRPAGAKPTAVLGGTTTQPRLLPRLAERLGEAVKPSEEHLRTAIAADLASVATDADVYQQRLYTATLLRAAREAFA